MPHCVIFFALWPFALCVFASCLFAYLRYAYSRYGYLRDACLRYCFLRYASFRDGHLQNRLVAIQLWIDAFMILDDFISNTDH